METDKYKNPENVDDVLKEITTLPTLGELNSLLMKHYPTWIVYSFKEYSNDYPSLTLNWENICKNFGVTKKIILLVEECKFDKDHSLINVFSDILTRSGFCVRKANDFVVCSVCNKGIPCKELYQLLQIKNVKIPETWSNKCSICS